MDALAVASPGAPPTVDASALQSATFLSTLASNYNNAQAETGGATLDASAMTVEVEPTPAPAGATRSFTRESGVDKDTTIPLQLSRPPTSDVTVTITSSDESARQWCSVG